MLIDQVDQELGVALSSDLYCRDGDSNTLNDHEKVFVCVPANINVNPFSLGVNAKGVLWQSGGLPCSVMMVISAMNLSRF
ncbi:hypothetical protein PJK54_14990 [Cobetia sp. MMG027]|uniref:hypothetical protein n=1 Tax=Cobetia sp. MMG027 TaxID=3021980 RepID=UPI0022FE8BC4|nr:hypothetical protein [Cobetia sp. MMG027]MDA5564968.1 hypothetical protein [Cobetia sp. MMG027]